MTTYTQRSHVLIGELATASAENTGRDNDHAFWTSAAQYGLPYWSAINAVGCLAAPSGISLLTHNTNGPGHVAIGGAKKLLGVNAAGNGFEWVGPIHAGNKASWTNTQSNSGADWEDITSATLTLTLNSTCTVMVWGQVTAQTSNASYGTELRAVCNSVNGTLEPKSFAIAATPLQLVDYFINVPSGSRTVKLQFKQPFVSSTCYSGFLLAIAFTQA